MELFEGRGGRAFKPEQLSEFCRHVGAMTGAGIILSRAMEILQMGTEHKKSRMIYGELQRMMQQGSSFSDALEQMKVFPPLMVNMFRAAEASGHLEETAKRLDIYYRKEHRMKEKIRTATLYPKILLLVSILVVLIVFLVVVPTIEPIFRGMELPLLTRILIFISRLISERWYLCVVLLIILAVIGSLLLKKRKVRIFCDRMKLHVPLVGRQLKIIYTARFARSESGLYSSGLPMVEGLEIAAKTIGNEYLEEQFAEVIRKVQGGIQLSHAIESVDGFDKKLAPVIFVGEETGKLDEMLERIAEGYEHDAEIALNRLVSM